MLGFYILGGKGYVMITSNFAKSGLVWHAKESMDDKFLIQKAPFKKSIPCGISQTCRHWLILDGHGSHLTLEAINEIREFNLYMIIIPSHTLHAFQPLNISCFKHFKTTFWKKNDATMAKRNYNKLNKTALARWVDKLNINQIEHQNKV
jgi:hypothetical protein